MRTRAVIMIGGGRGYFIEPTRADQHRAPLRRGDGRVGDLARDNVGLPLQTSVADGAC